ncbi:Prolyl oligopeptidase family protein [Symmachiella macrocystis]|uniref:Prolyl oligopeptidase family protein n=1 Tax=Symmachiella macrocystis TaxID=2527985 RepID=A0A5C6BP26_9PLAN|nr:alpha/beta hydrolase-fold protein [Symmachiella macrocystis]TWU13943.1 Prolyl oligopeptidase family protein [Symmachiella macrocystis]
MMYHSKIRSARGLLIALFLVVAAASPLYAQSASDEDLAKIREQRATLDKSIAELDAQKIGPQLMADVQIYSKAADWIARHSEFYRENYAKQTLVVLKLGQQRVRELAEGKSPWTTKIGTTARGYVSRVDESVQPYALSLPLNYTPGSDKQWPLYVKLHGRNGRMNEVSFIKQHDNRPPESGQDWIQLDVYGRTNNAYRWAGETDVFEAIADVKSRYNIEDNRITLWGFSMGGAGAWHLGLHHPSLWSSVGAGAGFVDFYTYQKQTELRPAHQHHLLHIYDAVDYALNADNVSVITYGGEKDAQLLASTMSVAAAKKYAVDIVQLIGPGMGHKFDPESLKKFMEFHRLHSQTGRPAQPGQKEIRFITYSLKYNRCEWLTIEEMPLVYQPAIVASEVVADDALKVTTTNVSALQVDPRISPNLLIDSSYISFEPPQTDEVVWETLVLEGEKWRKLTADQAERFAENPDLHKRHDLQGPIDDAFMEPFVCVRGTGKPWSQANHDWATWTLDRFAAEFDKWLRGKVLVIDDTQVTEEMIANKNLVLFGDPGSNSLLAKVLAKLPVQWTEDKITVEGVDYDPNLHGLSLVYPNPLNPRRYVVVNSGHTMHEKDFKSSNSWLFPRLGDIAVQKFTQDETGDQYQEETVFADVFNSQWHLPSGLKPAK